MLEIIIPEKKLTLNDLNQFKNNPFENVIKFVVDIKLNKIALGGQMHADAEKKLLETGSTQTDLWGSNLWPWQTPTKIEYTSLINIRPSLKNFSMEIKSDDIRIKVDEIVKNWIAL